MEYRIIIDVEGSESNFNALSEILVTTAKEFDGIEFKAMERAPKATFAYFIGREK